MKRSAPAHLLRPAEANSARHRALQECVRLVQRFAITAAELAAEPAPAAPAVKVTYGRSYTHDPRYQLDPAKPFVGEFTLEWQRKRRGRA